MILLLFFSLNNLILSFLSLTYFLVNHVSDADGTATWLLGAVYEVKLHRARPLHLEGYFIWLFTRCAELNHCFFNLVGPLKSVII